MELARQSGLPFIEQLDSSNYISIVLDIKFGWTTEDKNPQDDAAFKDNDAIQEVGKDLNYCPIGELIKYVFFSETSTK